MDQQPFNYLDSHLVDSSRSVIPESADSSHKAFSLIWASLDLTVGAKAAVKASLDTVILGVDQTGKWPVSRRKVGLFHETA